MINRMQNCEEKNKKQKCYFDEILHHSKDKMILIF